MPHLVNGIAQECVPGIVKSCPKDYICYYDSVDDRYICCGRSPAYCNLGKSSLLARIENPKQCTTDADCVSPLTCQAGACCIAGERIEPPPNGCPWGTRPLIDQHKQLVRCVPGLSDSCPEDTICYFDNVENSHRCCGKDPGEGCPSGSKPFKLNNQLVKCIPGDPSHQCPGKSICHWSYLTDRFQCCQQDNAGFVKGCPSNMHPSYGDGDLPRLCQKNKLGQCPPFSSCHFNFWIAAYQCCQHDVDEKLTMSTVPSQKSLKWSRCLQSSGRFLPLVFSLPYFYWLCSRLSINLGRCPPNQVAFVDPVTGSQRTCSATQPFECPAEYSCNAQLDTTLGLCCGPAGQCPHGMAHADSTPVSCSPTAGVQTCPQSSTCMKAIGGTSNQYLCCKIAFPTGSIQCPTGFTLEDGTVKECTPTYSSCKLTSSCLAVPGRPGVHVCCQLTSSFQNLQCPPFFQLPQGRIITCNPSAPMCPSPSICMESPGTMQRIYLCCEAVQQISTFNHCPKGFMLEDGQVKECKPAAVACRSGSYCLVSVLNPAVHVCCTPATSAEQCPANLRLQSGIAVSCMPGVVGTCIPGAYCLLSTSGKGTFLCCVGQAHFTCPVDWKLESGIIKACNPTNVATCAVGSSCLPTPMHPDVRICCKRSSPVLNRLHCPQQLSAYLIAGKHVLCTDNALVCPIGTACLATMEDPMSRICCYTIALTCLSPGRPYLIGSEPMHCDPSTSAACPVCQAAANAPNIHICCSSATYACPKDGKPYTLAGTVVQCSPTTPGSCPLKYKCVAAVNAPTVRICCPISMTVHQCPARFEPVLTAFGLNVFCDRTGAGCPSQSQCLPSVGDPLVGICCRPSTGDAFCPPGTSPLYLNGQPQFCLGPESSCPSPGYRCVASPFLIGQFICCSDGTPSLQEQCASGRPAYRQSMNVPFYCDPTLRQCPAEYDCEPSTKPHLFLCCLRQAWACQSGRIPYPTREQPQMCSMNAPSTCPAGTACEPSTIPSQYICCQIDHLPNCPKGWVAYLQDGKSPMLCSSPSDKSCLAGYMCLASDKHGIFICCKGSAALGCLSGVSPYLLPTGQPQICTAQNPQCPNGYSCQASTLPNMQICCATSKVPCPDGSEPWEQNGLLYICGMNRPCPAGYGCVQSHAGSGQMICCRQVGQDVCGPGQQPYKREGVPQHCDIYSPACPSGYNCQRGQSEVNIYYCCQAAMCATGSTLLNTDGQPRYCNPSYSTCPSGAFCQESVNLRGNYICCMPSGGVLHLCQCIGRITYFDSGTPKLCTSSAACPVGYECSSMTTTGQSVCCSSQVKPTNGNLCPQGDPYKDPITKQYHYCSRTNYACPPGFVCNQMAQIGSTGEQYICCSAKATCQPGWLPHINRLTNQPLRCSPTELNPCGAPGLPYKCQQSTVPGEYICCIESKIAMSLGKSAEITSNPITLFSNQTVTK
ncbi:Uncharacterized protein T4E_1500 [Trichinella pseudospiralis]|uniref:Uncharacterized protein n=1 Tax=Trichinella pseudospiralis TaxID=6337 RepID=A0A0V0Y8N5_TRIPS|nr:Uncharacterized protein T4E_1500 [Trichinella pseudospiralis]